MHTRACVFLLALLLLPALGLGEERNRHADVLALQEAVEQTIERAEPSIACILVSRSEGYRDFGAAPSDEPGKLGRFDPPRMGGFPGQDPRVAAARSLDLSNPETVPESYGSGVVLDESGLVLTQAHVVRKATKIYVRLPGNRGSWADIHASDPRSDLAVLRLLDRVPNLKPLKLGDGSKLRKGSFVLSLSNPFAAGFRDGSPSASWGIVSNLRRKSTGQVSEMERPRQTLHHFGSLIQTDTRLNLGCSGGALLNLDGDLVALTTSMAAISGGETPGGFAVPVDANMRRIIDVLRRGEEVEYGFLGVYLSMDSHPGRGVQLLNVADGSPAQRAGLLRGDYVLTINGAPVRENDDLFLLVGMQLAGSTVRIEVARTPNGPRRTCSVKLAKYYVPGPIIASRKPPAPSGLRVDYTSILSQRGRTSIPPGVVIREVLPDSPAARARLQLDTVITRVNGRAVNTPAEFYEAMAAARGPIELTLINTEGGDEPTTIDNK
jgi:serine protease Do